MSTISITELKVHRFLPDINDRIDLAKGIGGIELAIKFNIIPAQLEAQIQIAIYDANNQLIYWLHQGSRTYTKGNYEYPKIPAIVPANLTNIRVEAWITDNTRPDESTKVTPWGLKAGYKSYEKHRISNIATRSLNLSGAVHGTKFDRTRGQQTQPKEVTVEAEPGITVDSIVSGITQAVTIQEAAAEPQVLDHTPIPTLSQETRKIIDDFPTNIKAPDWALTYISNNINWLLEGQITETVFLVGYYDYVKKGTIILIDEPEPEQKETWWVTRPSGIIEQVSVTPSGKRKLESIGWKFSKEKPAEPEPVNADISVIFSSGTGGDLKTHFNFSSLVIDKNIQHELATWIMQNYGTSILLVTNRLTDNPITHNLQSIKDLIKQKILDDKPEEPDPEPDLTTSTSMVTQKLDYFDIIDGRANGQITFRATSDFNSYYYGKELVTYLQLVNKQGIVIAEKKANVLRFTQTEQDETIHYDEAVGDLEIVYATSTVETHDKRPMAENYEFKIKKDEPPEEEGLPRTDFLAKMGGVLAGSIAIALLLPKRIGK